MQKLNLSAIELRHFQQLDERQRRLFAVVEATKLGWRGWWRFSSAAYGINRKTIYKGKTELAQETLSSQKGIRISWGKKSALNSLWLAMFHTIVSNNTAGLPQDTSIKWTYLTQTQIQGYGEQSVSISRYYIRLILLAEGYKKRKMLKMKTIKEVEDRNEQFEKIANYRTSCANNGIPVLNLTRKIKNFG